MRGDDAICGSLFSYIDLEKRVRADHPLRVIRAIANAALKSLSGEFRSAVFAARPASRSRRSGCCGRCCCRRSIRSARSGSWSSGSTSTCCSAGLSGSASRTRCGTPRPSPRTATGCWRARSRPSSWPRCWRSRKVKAVAVERAFLGRRHAAGSLGQPEELPAEGRLGRAARRRAQRRARLPRRAARERHACLDHRSRRPAVTAKGRARRRSCASWAMR